MVGLKLIHVNKMNPSKYQTAHRFIVPRESQTHFFTIFLYPLTVNDVSSDYTEFVTTSSMQGYQIDFPLHVSNTMF